MELVSHNNSILKNIFVFIIASGIIGIQSCDTDSKNSDNIATSKDTSKAVENKVMIPNTVCYSGVIGKDTAFLKTEIFPNVVTGNLLYKFHEKDNNKGDIDGILKNDTLVADYKFSSEGQPSVGGFFNKRQHCNRRIWSHGRKKWKDGFQKHNDIDYGKGFVLKKVSCPLE